MTNAILNATSQPPKFYTLGNAAAILHRGPEAVRDAMQANGWKVAFELNGLQYVDGATVAKLHDYYEAAAR